MKNILMKIFNFRKYKARYIELTNQAIEELEKINKEYEKIKEENERLKEILTRTSPNLLLLPPIAVNDAIDVNSGFDIFVADKKYLFEKACKTIAMQDKLFLRDLYCYLRFIFVLQKIDDISAKKQICVFFTYLIPLKESSLKYIAEFELYLQTKTEEQRKL